MNLGTRSHLLTSSNERWRDLFLQDDVRHVSRGFVFRVFVGVMNAPHMQEMDKDEARPNSGVSRDDWLHVAMSFFAFESLQRQGRLYLLQAEKARGTLRDSSARFFFVFRSNCRFFSFELLDRAQDFIVAILELRECRRTQLSSLSASSSVLLSPLVQLFPVSWSLTSI